MKTIGKERLITQLEEQVEKHLQEAIRTFQNLDTSVLLKPSANGGWSIAQCLEHLNRYGNYYLPAIGTALENPKDKTDSNGVFKSSWLGSYFTKMMNPETGKRKIKTFKNYSPARELDAHAVIAEFISQQEKLLMLLRAARTANLNTIRIAISISKLIRLKLGDVFQFVIAHNERHIMQAKSNL